MFGRERETVCLVLIAGAQSAQKWYSKAAKMKEEQIPQFPFLAPTPPRLRTIGTRYGTFVYVRRSPQ